MMDFGLAGLLDRLERDFGAKWAKALTILITLAIIAGCLTVVGNLISAFSLWMSGITSEATLWSKIVKVGKYATGIALLVLIARNLASVTVSKTYETIARSHLHRSDELLQQSERLALRVHEADAKRQEHVAVFGDIVKDMAEITENENFSDQLWKLHASIVKFPEIPKDTEEASTA